MGLIWRMTKNNFLNFEKIENFEIRFQSSRLLDNPIFLVDMVKYVVRGKRDHKLQQKFKFILNQVQ